MSSGAFRLFLFTVIGFALNSGWAQDTTGSEPPSGMTPPIDENSLTTNGSIEMTTLETSNGTMDQVVTQPTENQMDTSFTSTILSTNLSSSVVEQSQNPQVETVTVSTDYPFPDPIGTTIVVPDESNPTVYQETTTQKSNTTTTMLSSAVANPIAQNNTPGMVTTGSTITTTPQSQTQSNSSLATLTSSTPTAITTTSSGLVESGNASVGSTTTTKGNETTTGTTTSIGTPTPSPPMDSNLATTTSTKPPIIMSTSSSGLTESNNLSTGYSTTTRSSRTTVRATTAVNHECVTSVSCVDPNAHCVSKNNRNTCECLIGFRRNSTGGRCLSVTSTTTAIPIQQENVTSPYPSTSTTSPQPVYAKKDMIRRASDLSKYESMDVVTLTFTPAVSVVEWIFEQDLSFRKTVAQILSSHNFSMDAEPSKYISVTPEQVLYVAPSPQVTNDGLLVAILVQNKERDSLRNYPSNGGVIARHKRDVDLNVNNSTGYLPSFWIVHALLNQQHQLEFASNLTVSSINGGFIPTQMYSLDEFMAPSLFERRLEIFIPLILVATVFFIGLTVTLVCIRSRTKSMATWDPPAGVIFGKASIKKETREDPQGCTDKRNSLGQHLATDQQCQDGEEQHMKHSACRLPIDDDVWVVPYEDTPSPCQPNQIKTQFEDTKL